ncbi:MAG: hypothetical protein D4Q79_01190 [Spirochaetia bacterium]|nr:MAG: hypothetical protein D4Q79_01190 [Spirochaetia bacterium]
MDPEQILKGRMAESLVSELLREAGNQVYSFGYESTLQNLTQVEKVFNRDCEIGEKIRDIPDLLVVNKNGEPFFIEVKFRWHQKWHKDDPKMLNRLSHFWRPIIIFVNCRRKPYFLITKPPYRDKSGELKGLPLESADYLNISKDILGKYIFLVEKYLTPTLNNH